MRIFEVWNVFLQCWVIWWIETLIYITVIIIGLWNMSQYPCWFHMISISITNKITILLILPIIQKPSITAKFKGNLSELILKLKVIEFEENQWNFIIDILLIGWQIIQCHISNHHCKDQTYNGSNYLATICAWLFPLQRWCLIEQCFYLVRFFQRTGNRLLWL